MMNVLILAPDEKSGPLKPLARELSQTGYRVGYMQLDMGSGAAKHLHSLFEGRPPDVIVADLSNASDCLPMRHASRLLSEAWAGSDPTPARLALFSEKHVQLPDWPAYIDDFILPPYAIREVTARIKLFAYRKRHIQMNHFLTTADLLLNLAENKAQMTSGQILHLTPREFELLKFLCQHRGHFFTRDKLLDLVWGVYYDGNERTVDVHIRRLRAKLPPGAAALIMTRVGSYGMTK